MSALRDIRAAARERRGAGYLGGDPPSSSIPPPSPSLEAVPASSLAVSRPPPPFARPPPRQHAPFNAVFQPPARQSSALDADETRPRREHGDEAAAEGSSDAGETRTSGDAPPGGGASDEEEEARGMGSEDTARASATHAARFDDPADEDGRRAADEDGHRAADEDRRRRRFGAFRSSGAFAVCLGASTLRGGGLLPGVSWPCRRFPSSSRPRSRVIPLARSARRRARARTH